MVKALSPGTQTSSVGKPRFRTRKSPDYFWGGSWIWIDKPGSVYRVFQVKQYEEQFSQIEKAYNEIASELSRFQSQAAEKDNQIARLMEDRAQLEAEMENAK